MQQPCGGAKQCTQVSEKPVWHQHHQPHLVSAAPSSTRAPLGLVPPGSKAAQGSKHLGDGAPQGAEHPKDLCTLGTGALQGLKNSGDRSPNWCAPQTRASQRLKHPGDQTTQRMDALWEPEHPEDHQGPHHPPCSLLHTCSLTLPSLQESILYHLFFPSLALMPPAPHPRDRSRSGRWRWPQQSWDPAGMVTMRNAGLPVPGGRAGLQQLQSPRKWALCQPERALCFPGEDGQRNG